MSGADAAQPAPNPYAWLWAEIARRFGDDAAADLHVDYLAECRAYNHRRWHTPPDPTPDRPTRHTAASIAAPRNEER